MKLSVFFGLLSLSLVVMVFVLCSSIFKSEKYHGSSSFELPPGKSISGEFKTFKVIPWRYSGRLRSLLVAHNDFEIDDSVYIFSEKKELHDLIDSHYGWGASELLEVKNTISRGGWVLRKKSGEFIGVCDKDKDYIIFPDKGNTR